MIGRYTPGQDLLMVRNPRFREWSAAAQPAGNPDRIVIRLDLSGARGAAAVADGTSDFLLSIGQVSSGAPYFQHHRSQLWINPQLITSFLSLNVNAAPFNDLRVRQAVNLALDRGRAVVGYGGPLAAQPTCQILPPGLAGYQRYCPYTRYAAADGSWRAPDLARARRLVAASGTAGMQVTVGDVLPSPQGAINEADDVVQALRQLGYRARYGCSRTAPTSPTPWTPATTPRSSTSAGAPTTPPPTISSASWPAPTSFPAAHSPPPTPANSAIPPWTGRSRGPPPSKPPTRSPPPPCGHS
jgi:ABC-type transport system substrate-binding protein